MTTPAPRTSRRLDILFHAVLAFLLLALGVLLVWRPLSGWLDFWAHAAVGRWTWETGRVPDRTLFLWTADEPWVYHSWLFQLVAFGLTQIGGSDHLPYVVLGFTALLVLSPFALAWLLWRRGGRLSAWLAVPFVLALKGPAIRFQTRPELFTVLGLCLLLAFLVIWSGRPRAERPDRIARCQWAELVAVLGLFVVWANLHGAVVIGVLALAVTAACDLVQDRFDQRSKVLTGLALLAPLAVCVNPFGWSYWQALRPVTSHTFGNVLEWTPIWKAPALPTEMAVVSVVLLVLGSTVWAMNPSRRWAHLAWLILLTALFLQARRNVWPFSLTCLLVIAANASAVDPAKFFRGSIADRVRWPVRGLILGWIALECLFIGIDIQPGQPLVPSGLDEGAVRYIREHELTGRTFNDYENSGYLQWRLAGRPALYIDLLNAYPDRVMRDYQQIAYVMGRARALLDEQQIEIVVLTTNRGGAESLADLADRLDGDPRWARVYVGGDGVIWVRRTPEYSHLWATPVGAVPFAVLERWGNDNELLSPPTRPPSFGPPAGKVAPATPK